MSVAMFVMYDIWGFFCLFLFLLLIEIISIENLCIIVHFFVLKHEKQTLSYIHTKFEGNQNKFFFSNLFCGSIRFSAQHGKLFGRERLMPLTLLGINRVKQTKHVITVPVFIIHS